MTSAPPTLRGSISQLERAVARYYSHLQQRFEGNSLVRTMWAAMGNDLQSQVESLKKLPQSFWQSLKNQEKELAHAAELALPDHANKAGSLQICLAQTLDLEEPIILKVYAPLIRSLRNQWTELALDFFVMVRAHIARVAHSVQLFSGDPELSLRCAILLQSFEREVQEPAAEEVARKKQPARKSLAKPGAKVVKGGNVKKPAKKTPVRTLTRIAKLSKPLVQKIEIARRRARR
jgi:hypothetical protein